MKHPLYDELRTLTDNPHVWAAIDTAAIEGAPAEMLQNLEKQVYILPAIPPGKRFSKECFWGKFQAKFVWHTAFGKDSARKDSAARWLQAMREAGMNFDYSPTTIILCTTHQARSSVAGTTSTLTP